MSGEITITITEIADAVSAVAIPASITVFDGVFVDSGGPGSGAVDSVNGETGTVVLSAADVGAQPVDSDLTAIAALTTTTFGRSLLTAADAAAARTLTGSGTSSLVLGTTSSTAKAGDYQPAAANISDASTIGKTVLTAASAAAIRTALSLGSAALSATTDFDAAGAAAAAQAASQPLDSDLTAIAALSTTTFGRSLLTAADAAAARSTLGAGTSSFDGAYSSLTGTPSLVPTTRTVAGHALSADVTITASDVSAVPTTRTVNGKALSSDITLTASDVSAQASDSDLTTIAGLTATTDSFMQAKSSAWAARTPTQVAADLALPIAAQGVTINGQTGTTYTLVLTDAGKFVTMTNASASTLTVPPNSSVAFAVGTLIDGAQLGAGQVTLTPGSGVTINGTPGLKVAAQYGTFALLKTATDTWLAMGRLSS